MKRRWAQFIWWLDDTFNHYRVDDYFPFSYDKGTHWRWLCDYSDYLVTGEWPK
jgi:hypothetical protein